jgi:ATP-dependent protease Clp ATPase subunit
MRVAADENGVIAAYNRLLVEEGKSFSLTEAAVRELASYALESKGYARVVKMGIAKCCELVMGGGQKGRTEFSLVEIRKVIDSMGDGG